MPGQPESAYRFIDQYAQRMSKVNKAAVEYLFMMLKLAKGDKKKISLVKDIVEGKRAVLVAEFCKTFHIDPNSLTKEFLAIRPHVFYLSDEGGSVLIKDPIMASAVTKKLKNLS